MYATFRFFAIMLIFTLMAGFFIVPTRSMPDNAIVFLDDANRTYLSPACADQEQKKYRPATAAEAQQLKYEPDKKCRRRGGLQPGRPLPERQLYGAPGHAAAPAQPLEPRRHLELVGKHGQA